VAPIGRAKPNWLIDSSVTMYSAAARSIACRCSSARISFSRTPWSLSTPIDAALRAPADGSHACSLARAGVGVPPARVTCSPWSPHEAKASRAPAAPTRATKTQLATSHDLLRLVMGRSQANGGASRPSRRRRRSSSGAQHQPFGLYGPTRFTPSISRPTPPAQSGVRYPRGSADPAITEVSTDRAGLTRGGRRPGQEKGGRCPDLPRGP
jgi:hypothetical protein